MCVCVSERVCVFESVCVCISALNGCIMCLLFVLL